MSNFELETVHDIPLHDMRPHIDSLSLDREGFIVAPLASTLRYEDFWDEKLLTDVYAEELRNFLLKHLHARSVFIHECVVLYIAALHIGNTILMGDKKLRNRSDGPSVGNMCYGQPVSIAHTGMDDLPDIN